MILIFKLHRKTRLTPRSSIHSLKIRHIRVINMNRSCFPIFEVLLFFFKKACSVKVWCTKVARILRRVVQTGAILAV